MKFSIITPTYKRADLLPRAVTSALEQTCTDWELIIVNDSPDDIGYELFEKTISDPRIIYLKNEQNMGVNFSRNRALDNVSQNSDWIIFLDDDDYLTPDTLATFRELIATHPDKKWFVTNRAFANGKLITNFPKSDAEYSYAWDYLILKRCKGDATHCIKIKLISNIRFSKFNKQAEEWLFYYQIGLKSSIFYHAHNSTLTDGYNETTGLNFRKRNREEQFKTFFAVIHEAADLHLVQNAEFLVYLFMRIIRVLIRS